MVELHSGTVVLPAAGVVALVAGFLQAHIAKRTAMWIRVAALTTVSEESRELHGAFSRAGRMALHAGYRLVLAGECEVRAVMIETLRGFPCILGVAIGALLAQLASMLVGVAERALPLQSEE